jgi:hypothetical protein
MNLTLGMFHQAIGVYRSRAFQAFNPLFWVEVFLNLPKHVLGYLGVKPDNLATRILNVIYWLCLTALTLVKPEMKALMRTWLTKIVPL